MNKIFLIVAFIFTGFLFQNVGAQLRATINGNINSQPVWGPTGYDYASYYYLPDIDMFYYIPKRQYIYQEQGGWIFSTALPTRYSTYDLYSGYIVVVNDIRPYQHVEIYRPKYASYKGGMIRK